MRSAAAVSVAALLALAACGDADDAEPATTAATSTSAADTTTAAPTTARSAPSIDVDQRFPDVIAAELTAAGDGTFRVSVTLSSPYDTPDRYADAWRVLGADGTVYGVRELLHDHQFEQPFTRSLDGVEIPADVGEVVIEGRDQLHGWGGGTVTVAVPEG